MRARRPPIGDGLRGKLQFAVIVAVAIMRMMQMAVHEVIDVIPVWHSLMSAVRTVNVLLAMGTTVVVGSTDGRIGAAHFNLMLVDISALNMM